MPALIFDCDGVLADTERYGHLPAFNQTFREFNLPVQWSKKNTASPKIAGGKERMASLLTPEFVKQATCQRPEEQKEPAHGTNARRRFYKQMNLRGLAGRPGVRAWSARR
jgi:beta-phosphoglucomutase-like phosphatase (HAD superfamily)